MLLSGLKEDLFEAKELFEGSASGRVRRSDVDLKYLRTSNFAGVLDLHHRRARLFRCENLRFDVDLSIVAKLKSCVRKSVAKVSSVV